MPGRSCGLPCWRLRPWREAGRISAQGTAPLQEDRGRPPPELELRLWTPSGRPARRGSAVRGRVRTPRSAVLPPQLDTMLSTPTGGHQKHPLWPPMALENRTQHGSGPSVLRQP
ncbi:hypothetical protein NDU88_006883 [Pleurodeles waltl]|uniref:Uncharacterized protein n=1 Tax=Pleurodeles waltl TaxID=8319 RepID=A0AAV7TZ24_PLEWA|nr:hypothetical protein NDU88_006883 [Pleurodeles waltl]